MNFHLFYGCTAFIFGLGLIEVGALYSVNSFKSLSYSEGRGIIEYYSPRYLVYIGEKYEGYKAITRALEDLEYNSGCLFNHLTYLVEEKIKGRDAVKGTHVYLLPEITTYTRCDGDNSLKITPGNEQVKITFSDAASCTVFAKFLHDQAARFGYGITLKN